jgi:hypothetical protein
MEIMLKVGEGDEFILNGTKHHGDGTMSFYSQVQKKCGKSTEA